MSPPSKAEVKLRNKNNESTPNDTTVGQDTEYNQ